MVNKNNTVAWTDEERSRIVGFFALLLKVDRRTNPHLYKKKKVKSK